MGSISGNTPCRDFSLFLLMLGMVGVDMISSPTQGHDDYRTVKQAAQLKVIYAA